MEFYTIGLVILVILAFIIYTWFDGPELFTLPTNYNDYYRYPEADKSWTPSKMDIDKVSANNALTFTGNKLCNQKKVSWADNVSDTNWDCGTNPEYLESMCLQRRGTIKGKERLCNNLTGIVQFPQNTSNPMNFQEF